MGSFGDWFKCTAGYPICGILTLIESYQGSGDDTGLNNVKFDCCGKKKVKFFKK
jgi:hypothetical protein